MVRAAAAVVLAVGLLGAGCSGNGNRSSALTASEHKYCTLVKQFQDHLPAKSADPDPEQFASAMNDALQRNAKYFEDLLAVTPAEIKPDVEKALSALRQVAATGDISAYDGVNLTRADQWEGDHCDG
ncbi:MAG TPA: hypothetical protein VHL53_13980 [Acidimicrobiia bacterium]|nr:hypothetical protein [Acidimicrobiia bacterium]